MKCPYCGYLESKVVDSRPADEGASIRRRRECLSCHKRFTTYETVESLPIRACEKRPVPYQSMEALAAEIEQILQNQMDREVSTARIGELVMERLKALDEVAYVRFASVYREFKDIGTFLAELNNLLKDK